MGKNYTQCLYNCNQTIHILENLGFIINKQKSNLVPVIVCKFLGVELNSKDMLIQLPLDKRRNVLQLIKRFESLKRCKIREFSSFIGVLGFCCQASTYGWVYTKDFEKEKIQALEHVNGNYDAYMHVNSKLKESFNWWETNILKINNPIRNSKFELEIFTDSSTSGWGAHCNKESIHGVWKAEERVCHINYLELLASFLGLQSFAKHINSKILLRMLRTIQLR